MDANHTAQLRRNLETYSLASQAGSLLESNKLNEALSAYSAAPALDFARLGLSVTLSTSQEVCCYDSLATRAQLARLSCVEFSGPLALRSRDDFIDLEGCQGDVVGEEDLGAIETLMTAGSLAIPGTADASFDAALSAALATLNF